VPDTPRAVIASARVQVVKEGKHKNSA